LVAARVDLAASAAGEVVTQVVAAPVAVPVVVVEINGECEPSQLVAIEAD
jgi:hypothetical protein